MKTKFTLLTGMVLLGNIAFAQPANDICDDAIDISELLTGEIGALDQRCMPTTLKWPCTAERVMI